MSHVYQSCQRSKELDEWKIKTFSRWTLLKTHRDSTILHSRTAKKLTDNVYKKNFRIFKRSRRNYCDCQWSFGALTKVRTMEENYSLGRHSETHAKLVMKLLEAASWFCWAREGAILTPGFAVVNGCIGCICSQLLVICIDLYVW